MINFRQDGANSTAKPADSAALLKPPPMLRMDSMDARPPRPTLNAIPQKKPRQPCFIPRNDKEPFVDLEKGLPPPSYDHWLQNVIGLLKHQKFEGIVALVIAVVLDVWLAIAVKSEIIVAVHFVCAIAILAIAGRTFKFTSGWRKELAQGCKEKSHRQ